MLLKRIIRTKQVYRGVIGKVRRNGTYDLQYDDGDKESKVPADRIRADQESEGKGSDDDGDGDYNEEEEEEEAPEKIPRCNSTA